MADNKGACRKLIGDRIGKLVEIITSDEYKSQLGDEPRFWIINHNARSSSYIVNAVTLYSQLDISEELAKHAFGARKWTKVEEFCPMMAVHMMWISAKFISPKSLVEAHQRKGTHIIPEAGRIIIEEFHERVKNRYLEKLRRKLWMLFQWTTTIF
jgi:hypothetical protein